MGHYGAAKAPVHVACSSIEARRTSPGPDTSPQALGGPRDVVLGMADRDLGPTDQTRCVRPPGFLPQGWMYKTSTGRVPRLGGKVRAPISAEPNNPTFAGHCAVLPAAPAPSVFQA
jgi:hypothetical protein